MKTILKISLLSTFFFFSLETKAQQPLDFNAEDAAGIFTYDEEKVIKKLKVEDKDIKQTITNSIGEYNLQMYQLSDKYAATFSELDAYFDRQIKVAMQQRDRSQMDGVKSRIRETIPPIRQEVLVHEKELNASMESALDEKQYSKWLKYQKSQKPSNPSIGG